MDGVQPAAEASPILRAALWYAARDLRVHPLHGIRDGRCTCGDGECSSPGKHPLVRAWQQHATAETRQIRQWWAQWPWANVAIVADDRVIIDVDGDAGYSSLDVLEHEHGELPPTPRSRTARGQHIHFAAPVGSELSISAGALGLGLDVRAGNGYVVAPPSVHVTGVTYSWISGMGPHEIEVAPAPDWLIGLLRKDRKDESGDIDFSKLFDGEPEPAETTDATDEDDEDDEDDNEKRAAAERERKRREAYLAAAVDRELAAVAHAPEGTRNDQLNRSSYWLGRLVAGGELHGPTIARQLAAAAQQAGLKDKEIRVTLTSGMKAGAQDPRRVPDAEPAPARTRTNGHARMDDDGDVPPPADADCPEGGDPGAFDPSGILPIDASRLPEGVQRGTDLATAYLLRQHHGRDLAHVPSLGWLAYDGIRWVPNAGGEVARRLHAIGRGLELHAAGLHAAAAREQDEQEQAKLRAEAKAFSAWARSVQSEPGSRRASTVAESLLVGAVEDFDKDAFALNVLNGTVDLRTAELRPHRRDDKITKLAPVHFDADAKAPTFDAFMARVLPADAVREFALRTFGYGLTGSTAEQCLFVLHGGGANGKSTLLETVRRILGDYAAHAQTDTFMRSGQRGPDNDLARLRGARFVTAIESGEGRKLDEERVKQLTGSDTVTARFLYREPFEFRPAMKVVIATNHRPQISGDDDAIWRRLRLIGFDVQIPEQERDGTLQEKLAAEAPGILAQLVRAGLDWQQGGLRAPDAVLARTREWREDSDLIGNFIADECVCGDHCKVQSSVLYAAFSAWCKAQGVDAPTQKAFSGRIEKRGFERKPTKTGVFVLRIGLIAKGEG